MKYSEIQQPGKSNFGGQNRDSGMSEYSSQKLQSDRIRTDARNLVRSFGLFGPRAVGKTSAAVFALLKKELRSRPKPQCWAGLMKRKYGRDPLLDDSGQRMRWARRIVPQSVA